MGRGKSSFFASLFGCKKQGSSGRQEEAAAASSFFASLFGCKKQGSSGRQEEAAAARPPPPQRYYHGTRVRPSDDDDYYGQNWYADRDINRRASEYIERVHRGMLASEQDE